MKAERAAVDDDGAAIRLALSRGPDVLAAVALNPLQAIGLGSELIAAGYRRLRAAPSRMGHRRGGDPKAHRRGQRDEALCELAMLIGDGEPAERLARTIATELRRYRPMPGEKSPARRLMRQIIESGLPVPGPDRLKRIIKNRVSNKGDWIPENRL